MNRYKRASSKSETVRRPWEKVGMSQSSWHRAGSQYENLRKLREAKFNRQKLSRAENAAAVEKKQRPGSVTNNPPNPPAVTNNPAISVTPKRGRGRPKTGKALSAAEKQRRYRARRKAAGEPDKG